MNENDGPGSAVYAPTKTERDGILMPRTRSSQASTAFNVPIDGQVNHSGTLKVPNPSEGGEFGSGSRLGWSEGFGRMFRRASFTGATLVGKSLGVNPVEGHVGFSTRQQKLRNGVISTMTDSAPDNEAVAKEIVGGF